MAAATCPLVIVQTLNGDMATDATVPLPDFMKSFISPNIVNFIHSNISKKSSLSRLPLRRPGSLQKHVSWQHCKININQKRYAVVSGIAASAIPSLARSHCIETVPKLLLVISDAVVGV